MQAIAAAAAVSKARSPWALLQGVATAVLWTLSVRVLQGHVLRSSEATARLQHGQQWEAATAPTKPADAGSPGTSSSATGLPVPWC